MNFWARRTIAKNLFGALLTILLTGVLTLLGRIAGVPSVWTTELFYCALLLGTLAVTHLYDKLPAAWIGLGIHRWTGRELLQGALLGVGMGVVAWIPIAAWGSVRIDGEATILSFSIMMIYLLALAAGEEILFRGYLFQRLVETIGPVASTLLVSLAFAIAHFVDGREASPLSVLNIFLAGVLFALGYLRTGSLWLPMAMHAAWNIFFALIVGLRVSGLSFGGSLVRTIPMGPDFLTGGSFGPEGSITATVALAIGIALLARHRRIIFSPYVHASIFRAFYRNQRARIAETETAAH